MKKFKIFNFGREGVYLVIISISTFSQFSKGVGVIEGGGVEVGGFIH